MNSDDDENIDDKEEESPERLRKKWDVEEFEEVFYGKKTYPCPHCGKSIDQNSITCLFCERKVYFDSGLLGRLSRIILDGKWVIILALALSLVFLFSRSF